MEKLGDGDPLGGSRGSVLRGSAGAYRLLARLGAGGMGNVYLARSDRGRTVAVKLVRRELAEQEEFRARFRQEVQAAQRVGGYWTTPVLDADTEADVPWVATGYVAGPTLQTVVSHDHGPLPERSVRVLAAGLAHALLDIHAAGLIHRDLKPSNVLVTIDGPRVIDFGIARALETVTGAGLTRAGALVGSPGFMAPEQVRGDRVTPACDVFCLGSVLAYAATGALPFGTAGSGVHALMFRIAQEEPDLVGVPESLADLVRECLRKDPAARPTPAQILERTGAEDTVLGGRTRDPWLPSALVAQLGRHAVRLLDAEDPEEAAQAADSGRLRGEDGSSGVTAAGGAAAGGAGAAGAANSGGAANAAGVANSGGVAASSGGVANAAGVANSGGVAANSGGVANAAGVANSAGVAANSGGVANAAGAASQAVPVGGGGAGAGAGGDVSGTRRASVPGAPGVAGVPGTQVPGVAGVPAAAASGVPEVSPEHAPAPDARDGTALPPAGQPTVFGRLPTQVVPPGPTPPHAHPAYGYPQQHPQQPAYGHPQNAGGWGDAPTPGHGPAVGPTPPYGPPPYGSSASYGPPPYGDPGRPEPQRRSGRSTAALIVVALVVALGAGGSVYALMRGDGTGTGDDGAPSHTSAAPTTPGPSTSAPSTSASASPTSQSPAAGAVPADYLGTWTAVIDNSSGHNTRRLVIQQGEVGDAVLSLTADGPAGSGTYHCVFQAKLKERPTSGGPLEVGSSKVTVGEPASSCSPGAATELTILPDGRLKRVSTDSGESLTYEKEG
ncbi:protein kinase [Streptomyces yaanensis]|uniref:Protein kinase n=1 Tax=Streptomyces yaanensis TaxID=1142239 RepID=A0ABV7SAD2_9ACTN|nr:protein kinase [Streptomyces sp. CGMCC 4.7035]WNB96814.1 protein kinase [Streptomyces sp. CGMCC 4.7035]